ncbi:MAG: ADP-ribosylglycohydrolase family protein [Proteobacteria bacterium]|nr:ADP-ribosylglycohydrolase family protein [Pseudomonadota bacterium]
MTRSEQISGLIFGATAGDCLGTPYVFMKSKDLFQQASQICWHISDSGGCAQMMFTAIHSISKHGTDLEKLARSYQNWVHKGQSETDYVTALCFDHKKYLSRAELIQNAQNADYGALCSGQLLIRQLPLVLACATQPLCILNRLIEADTRLSHADEDTLAYAKLYAQCLHGILNGRSRVEIWDQLFKQVECPRVYKTLLCSYYDKPVCDSRDYSHAQITLGISLYHFWHNTPFVSALRSTILSGGATDINAAAVGALLGASQGLNAIPAPWRACLLETDNCERLRHSIIKAERLVSPRTHDLERPSRRALPPRSLTLTSSADKQNK